MPYSNRHNKRKSSKKQKIALYFGVCLAASGIMTKAQAYPTVFPTGVTIYDKAAAYNCDILFTPLGDPVPGSPRMTYLINMDGAVVHDWPYSGLPSQIVNPALWGGEKGVIGVHLSYIKPDSKDAAVDVVPHEATYFLDKSFGFVSWDGKILWQWSEKAPHGLALQHHDWDVLSNGDVLILSNLKHVVPGFGKKPVLDDVIYKVNKQGNILWRWSALEHLDQLGFTPSEIKLVKASTFPDVLHINDMRPLGPNKWAANGDSRFAPDNIILSSRNANFTAIINGKTGDVVWEIGPNYAPLKDDGLGPDKLPRPIDQISGQHSPYMIPEGLPGAGDILLLDNQEEAGYPPVPLAVAGGSRVLEINPETKDIVWDYTARDSGNVSFSFFTPYIGNVQRLPNGNTLINEGIDGRIFQVTPAGKIVWEYVSPYKSTGPGAPIAGRPQTTSNWIYRAQAVPLSWIPGGHSAQ